ncbi:uncharacterized protein LOC114852868 [Betta splendens]|uniref:Uncharacterized protein LOC114852868 n=1 Tax=Betta splendens TaxID=158456 RepID=A0A9W2XSS1_BETSP|nr:uncharacterized protein LOC114852868 [Betta splendens]
MIKSVFVAVVLVTLAESGLAAEKLATCCEKVTRDKITDPILGYLFQREPVLPCINAVIFQTEKGLFCVDPRAPWVLPKIQAFRKTKGQSTASPSVSPSHVSLLSLITSSAPGPSPSAPGSSSSAPGSSPFTPEMPVDGNVSGQMESSFLNMVSWGITMKSVLVAVVLMTLTEHGLAAEKLATCCETASKDEITDPIIDYLFQRNSSHPCVIAVIFQTEKGLFCAHPRAPWVIAKIQAFRKAKSQTIASPTVSPSHVSLLSMITSSASGSSSSAPGSSFSAPGPSSSSAGSSSSASSSSSSTAEMPVGGQME